jgi:HEAT repeat protein
MRAILAIFAAVLSSVLFCAAQQASATHADISHALEAFQSERWVDRERAFNNMPAVGDVAKQYPAEADRLKVGLINLLVVENKHVKKTEELSEEYTDYYGDLVGRVSDLNDERAIPALIGAITTGGMATRALARFGDKALDQVLGQLNSSDRFVRSSALDTISDLLERHIAVSPTSQSRISDALRSSLNDPQFIVRRSAIGAIEYLDTREEFVPALVKLAQSDPIKFPGKPNDGGDGGQFYPVRQDARRLLRKIANHEPPAVDRGVIR